MPAGAHHRRQQLGVGGIGDVIDGHAVEISLEQVVALEGQVRIRESKPGDGQMHFLGKLRNHSAYAHLADHLLNLGVIGIGGAQLECVGLFEQEKVLESH